MRVLICGSRDWTDYEAIETLVNSFEKDTVVIQGLCRGTDLMARAVALKRGLEVEDYPAEWGRFGSSAGPIRNEQMLNVGHPHVVYAFLLPQSRGTRDMIEKAKEHRIPVIIMEAEA